MNHTSQIALGIDIQKPHFQVTRNGHFTNVGRLFDPGLVLFGHPLRLHPINLPGCVGLAWWRRVSGFAGDMCDFWSFFSNNFEGCGSDGSYMCSFRVEMQAMLTVVIRLE